MSGLEGWGEEEELEGDFGEVPAGPYQAKWEKFEVAESDSSGRLQVNVDFQILSGELKGRHVFDHWGLESKQNRDYVRTFMARVGADWPNSGEDLPEVGQEECVGKLCDINVRKKGDFTNVYVQRELDADDVEETPDGNGDGDAGGGDWEKGGRVTVPLNGDCEVDVDGGEPYAGKIVKLDEDEETAKVKFDDGDVVDEIPWDALTPEEEDGKDDAKEDGDNGNGNGDGGDVEISFTDKKLTSVQKRTIKRLAKDNDFSVDDYDKLTDLLADVAESVGVSGEFKSPTKLIKAVQDA